MNTDIQLAAPIPVAGGSRRQEVAADVDFNRRWDLWVKRGRVHDRRVRRRFGVFFTVLAIGVVLLFAFLR